MGQEERRKMRHLWGVFFCGGTAEPGCFLDHILSGATSALRVSCRAMDSSQGVWSFLHGLLPLFPKPLAPLENSPTVTPFSSLLSFSS